MKTLLALIITAFIGTKTLAFQTKSSSAPGFKKGVYECVKGNNPSICPQRLVQKVQNNQRMLSVVYSGYCNDQGPYVYGCEDADHCGDGLQTFEKVSEDTYEWQNVGYSIRCLFQLHLPLSE